MKQLTKNTVVFLVRGNTVGIENNNQSICHIPNKFPLFLLEEMANRVLGTKQDLAIILDSSLTITRFNSKYEKC